MAATVLAGNVMKARAGDTAAFEALVHEHRRKLIAIGLRVLGNREDAEDAAQESLLVLFKKLGTFRGESRLSTWITRIGINTALMKRRSKKCRGDYANEPLANDWPHHARLANDLQFKIVDQKIDLEPVCEAFRAALKEMPDGYLRCFVAYFIFGLRHKHIAELFGVSLGNSKSNTFRAADWLEERCPALHKYTKKIPTDRSRTSFLRHLSDYAFDLSEFVGVLDTDPLTRIDRMIAQIQS